MRVIEHDLIRTEHTIKEAEKTNKTRDHNIIVGVRILLYEYISKVKGRFTAMYNTKILSDLRRKQAVTTLKTSLEKF